MWPWMMLHGVVTEDTAPVTPPHSCPCSRCSKSPLLQLPSCNKTWQTWPVFLRPQDNQTTLRLPRFLMWDIKRPDRRAHWKQEDVQETPAVSHASSAENVSSQLSSALSQKHKLLWVGIRSSSAAAGSAQGAPAMPPCAWERCPRGFEVAVLRPGPLPWEVYSSARPPSGWKSLLLKSNLNPWHSFRPFPPSYL